VCLIAIAVDTPGPWLLVVAANRDEFHDRHAAPATWWSGTRHRILAGRDLQGGGTWLGLQLSADARRLRVAALTNLRPGLMPAPQAPAPELVPPSRGGLVAGLLESDDAPLSFLRTLEPPPSAYAGFNLLAARLDRDDGVEVGYLNNLPGTLPRRLAGGVHALSNATLDVEWPKTRLLARALEAAIADAAADADSLTTALLEALADRRPAPAAELPRTGLDPAREQLLSAPFIVDAHYGTRCSTVVAVGRDGTVSFTERRFGPAGGELGTVRERFSLAWDEAVAED
jgi:uncharacterized protein with NRDE domain